MKSSAGLTLFHTKIIMIEENVVKMLFYAFI